MLLWFGRQSEVQLRHYNKLPTSANYYMFREKGPLAILLTSLAGCTYCWVTGWKLRAGVQPKTGHWVCSQRSFCYSKCAINCATKQVRSTLCSLMLELNPSCHPRNWSDWMGKQQVASLHIFILKSHQPWALYKFWINIYRIALWSREQQMLSYCMEPWLSYCFTCFLVRNKN